MGYTTEFEGHFDIKPAPSPEIAEYVNRFSQTRHMKRDVEAVKRLDPDWEKHCLDGDLGPEGLWYIPDNGRFMLEHLDDGSVTDCNVPPAGAPGLWCQWILENGKLVWDGGEKFYEYDRWLGLLVKGVFEPRGYTVEGDVQFRGEDFDDMGILSVHDGEVSLQYHDCQWGLSTAELIAGADVLNAYYRAVEENGIDRMDATCAAAEEAIDSYETLLSDRAEKAGCYDEWYRYRSRGLEEARS